MYLLKKKKQKPSVSFFPLNFTLDIKVYALQSCLSQCGYVYVCVCICVCICMCVYVCVYMCVCCAFQEWHVTVLFNQGYI